MVRKKDYGNVEADEYGDWFKRFAAGFHRILKRNGSLVIDIGGAWNKGYPTRSLYHFKLLIMLLRGVQVSLGTGFLLVESVQAPHTRGMGHSAPSSRQGRREHRMVAVQDTVAEGQQSNGFFSPTARACRRS